MIPCANPARSLIQEILPSGNKHKDIDFIWVFQIKAHYGKIFILIYIAVNTTIIISATNSHSFISASSLGSLCTSPTYALGSQTEINYRAIYAIRNNRIIFCMIEEYLKKYTIHVICINGGVIIKMNSKKNCRRFYLLILTAKMYLEIV